MQYSKSIYSVELELLKSPHAVFAAAIALAKWWPEEYVGESIGPGVEFILKTGEGHYSKNKVVEYIQDRKLVWLTTGSRRETDGFDWSGTRFIFEVTPKDDRTQFRFIYDGVVLEGERERLAQICDICIKVMFYNFIESYKVVIEVGKPAHEVFRCITAGVAKWWGGKDLTGCSMLPGDEFIIDHPGAHYSKQKVVELIPDKRIVWLVTGSDLSWLRKRDEWTGTKMVFELAGNGDRTVLAFMHEGLTPEKECYVRCSQEGWGVVIKEWLFDFITFGRAHF